MHMEESTRRYCKEKKEFWDFSFHEFGVNDLPAIINFIINHTKVEKINYIGHSIGGTQLLVAMSLEPEYFNKTLKNVVLLSPNSRQTRIGIREIYGMIKSKIYDIPLKFRTTSILLDFETLNKATSFVCKKFKLLCNGAIEMMTDTMSSSDINLEQFNVFTEHYPSGTSLQNIRHIAMNIREKQFLAFDYGKDKNLVKYNSETPPEYNLNLIKNKICLLVGERDHLVVYEDSLWLRDQLENIGFLKMFKSYSEYKHYHFILGNDARYIDDILHCFRD